MTVFETERLTLRELTPDDLDDLATLYADPVVMHFWPSPYTRPQSEANLQRLIRMYDEHGYGLWATIRKADGQFLGRCGLLPYTLDGAPEIELGWMLGKEHWGFGYATEASKAGMEFAFRNLNAPRVIALIRPENEPSIRVALRLGMRPWSDTEHAGLPHRVYLAER
ncbi:MAG TPA: GNAT family N-acetyltransferase [Armatimonadota bacterium]|jgi:ribosomal-protein-alanine N-acetyltransferase